MIKSMLKTLQGNAVVSLCKSNKELNKAVQKYVKARYEFKHIPFAGGSLNRAYYEAYCPLENEFHKTKEDLNSIIKELYGDIFIEMMAQLQEET